MTEPIKINAPLWEDYCRSDPCLGFIKAIDPDGSLIPCKTGIDVAAGVDTTYFCEIGSDGVLREITREEYLGE